MGKMNEMYSITDQCYFDFKKHGKSYNNLIFSVDPYVLCHVESISAMYIFVLCIINQIINIFDTWAEIAENTQ